MDYRNIQILFLSLIGTILFNSTGFAQTNQLVVIGNDIGKTEITFDNLVDYFKAKNAYWENNKAITLCLPGTKSEDAEKVCSIVYRKSVKDVQKFWLSIVFQGRAKSPVFFETELEMLEYVKKTPGAIGVLLNSSKLSIPSQFQIKVIN